MMPEGAAELATPEEIGAEPAPIAEPSVGDATGSTTDPASQPLEEEAPNGVEGNRGARPIPGLPTEEAP